MTISTQPSPPRALVTTPSDREIRIEREFDAPRDRVFALITDPRLAALWWGPHGTRVVVEEMDARTGGDWRFRMTDETGVESVFRGTYREVVAPERIVQTFEWSGMPGYVSVETAVFEDLGERTRLVAVSLFHTTAERDGMLQSGMEDGMNETYERFDALLAR